MNSLGSLLSLLMYFGDSIFEKTYDFFKFFFDGVELFLLDLCNYNCVRQNYFLVNVFQVLMVLSLVYI